MSIEVRGGTFGYGADPIISKLDLPVRDNRVLTILGKNGVGKTTLLKCMMGFLKWREGQTLLDGKPLQSYPSKEVWKRISYVPQAKRSPFAFSVLDTVVMGLNANARAFSVPSRDDYDKARAVLESLGMSAIMDKDSSEISGGELQMVLIARALVSDPQILILDEPESNLDMRNQLRVLGAIEKVSEAGATTCIINTHFPEHALSISDDTLFLGGHGRMLLGPTAEVVTRENIRRFYGVEASVVSVQIELERPACEVCETEGASSAGADCSKGADGSSGLCASVQAQIAGDGPLAAAESRVAERVMEERLTIYPYRICEDAATD